MKRDKLRIGVITAALAMMIAGGVLTWQQDAERRHSLQRTKAPELQNSRRRRRREMQTERVPYRIRQMMWKTVWNRCRKWKRRVKKRRREIQKQMQRRLRIHRKNEMGIQKDRTRRR